MARIVRQHPNDREDIDREFDRIWKLYGYDDVAIGDYDEIVGLCRMMFVHGMDFKEMMLREGDR